MAKNPKTASGTRSDQKTLSFEYIKSQFFRVIHADGAIGSITPTGNLHIAFYSERPAIPKMTVHVHKPDGTIGEQLSDQTVSRSSIIREMDVDVVIDPRAIDGLIEWLLQQKKTSNNKKRANKNKSSEGEDDVKH